ncbi:TPA: hypothetical protein N0F65_003079 [Lagenidium giganteum]|uniref:MULE transposase domain-containing protein n=1 Tax=Lagenidium giganteum TaxID=4803 RepID=A0AAV2YP81_9STRA|nr:TPA: hypothetical protein N0F65_003079 [Lagenidium giganteum]
MKSRCLHLDSPKRSTATLILGTVATRTHSLLAFRHHTSSRYLSAMLTFVLHFDATYKTNKCAYPVFVAGISDVTRSFFPVAFIVASQQTQAKIENAFFMIKRQFGILTGKTLIVRYCMGDADREQLNAFKEVFNHVGTYLTYYFHVLQNVRKRPPGNDPAMKSVLQHIYKMHYANNEEDFRTQPTEAIARWNVNPHLGALAEYFQKQWVDSEVWRWQCFHTRSGMATTSNPCETFNKIIKTYARSKFNSRLDPCLTNCCILRESPPSTA